jgi:hypothetical protein
MKLRLSGQSIRLRLLRSEVAQLIDTGCVQESLFLGAESGDTLSYALETDAQAADMEIRHSNGKIAVLLPYELAKIWADTEQVGLYATMNIGGNRSLDLIVEKDFACLDLSDADNEDTFPNPLVDTTC